MKILPSSFDNKDIMPLNIYYTYGSYNERDDYIDIVFKDMDTGKKYVETISNPKVEIWVTKPEHRNYDHIRNYVSKDICEPVYVSHKFRYIELANILGVPANEVKYSPYIFGFDQQIENFYYMHFLLEYGNDKVKKLTKGFLDIENDVVNIKGFPEAGEAPINMVTYIDETNRQVYTLVLKQNNIILPKEDHSTYTKLKELSDRYDASFEYFENHIEEFQKMCIDEFQEFYGELDYNILIFENEIDLINTVFEIIRLTDVDFIDIWNAPYDVSNLVERIKKLGYNPNELIVDDRYEGKRDVNYEEDKNPNTHKRKHKFNLYLTSTITDQMVKYAGIRSGKGKLPSTKLNAIAKTELKDEKLDYSDIGFFKYFIYQDLQRAILYNIKDVLLCMGIERKTKDADTFYTFMYRYGLLPDQVFTSTMVIAESLRKFFYKFGKEYVMGSNKSKLYGKNQNKAFMDMIYKLFKYDLDTFDDFDENMLEELATEAEDDEGEDKFKGALVLHPNHMNPTGFMLLNQVMKFIHEHVIDFDITSEYPTAMLIMNVSNETMVGKVFFTDPDDIKIEIYENFNFADKEEEEKYNIEPGVFMMEILSQGDILNFGELFLNLPSIESIVDSIDKDLDKYVK